MRPAFLRAFSLAPLGRRALSSRPSSARPCCPVLALCGTTATGKSRVAASVASKVSGELVNCDSVKLYSGLDIGSNKSALLKHAHAHGLPVPHLIDVAHASSPWSAGDFVRAARVAIESIQARGKVAVLVGGSALYLDALLGSVALTVPPRDPKVTSEIEAEVKALDWEQALSLLARVSPERARQLQRNDRYRLVRALEIHRTSNPLNTALGVTRTPLPALDSRAFVLTRTPRTRLYRVSDARCEDMLAEGLVREVAQAVATRALSLNADSGPEAAIGYAHVLSVLRDPKAPRLESVRSLVRSFQSDTRRLAKKQLSWWRHDTLPLVWLNSELKDKEEEEEEEDKIISEIMASLSMDDKQWRAHVASVHVAQRNADLSETDSEEQRSLRTYVSELIRFDERSPKGRAASTALLAELTLAHIHVHSSLLKTHLES